jgi:hypothetical protein
MAGPKHTGTLGDEVGLTDFRVPVAHGSDHIDSRVASSSIRVDFPSKLTHVEAGLYITGAVTASGGINAGSGLFGTLQTAAQTNVTSVGTLTSLTVSGDLTVDTSTLKVDSTNNRVGVGTTSPGTTFHATATGGTFSSPLGNVIARFNATTNTAGQGAGIALTALATKETAWVIAAEHTSGNNGDMTFYGYQGGATYVELMRLNNAGNLGLGVTPSAWSAGKAMEIGAVGNSVWGNGAGNLRILSNAYFNSTFKYASTGAASQYSQDGGVHAWYNAASGTAGNNITFTQAMTLDASGNLGIGTTAPRAKLEVNGDILTTWGTDSFIGMVFQNGSEYRNGIKFNSSARSTGLVARYSDGTGYVWLGAGPNEDERVRVTAAGNVGIGTTNPTVHSGTNSALVVRGAGTSRGIIEVWDGNGTGKAVFQQVANTTYVGNLGGNGDLILLTNGTGTSASETMTLKASGNVGIGTTSPEARLDIIGATQGTITTLGSEVPGLILQQRLTSDANGNAGPMIDFRTSNGADVWTQGAIATIAAGTYAGQMAFYTQPGGTTDTTGRRTKGASLVERMRIDESGNVGIGITNPANLLHVKASGNYGTIISDNSTNTGGGAFGVRKNGSVIGYLLNKGSWYGDTTNDLCVAAETGFNFRIYTDGSVSEKFIFTTGGNFGIGTTNPGAKLHVPSGNVQFVFDGSTEDTSSYFYVGKNWGATNHRINRQVTQGNVILVLSAYGASSVAADTAIFYSINSGGANGAATALNLGQNSTTSRSLNAGGTINASGADYAEYMTKNGDFNLSKGDICGVDANGKLTNKFSKSHSFVVKSTNPSYVGGDTWGNEQLVGQKPYLTTQDSDESEEDYAVRVAKHNTDMEEFNIVFENARKLVDRIAFSGQVPVNVYNANVGDYIIPIEDAEDTITGLAVASPSFEQYQKAVGKVWKILEDGRALISVKIG